MNTIFSTLYYIGCTNYQYNGGNGPHTETGRMAEAKSDDELSLHVPRLRFFVTVAVIIISTFFSYVCIFLLTSFYPTVAAAKKARRQTQRQEQLQVSYSYQVQSVLSLLARTETELAQDSCLFLVPSWWPDVLYCLASLTELETGRRSSLSVLSSDLLWVSEKLRLIRFHWLCFDNVLKQVYCLGSHRTSCRIGVSCWTANWRCSVFTRQFLIAVFGDCGRFVSLHSVSFLCEKQRKFWG